MANDNYPEREKLLIERTQKLEATLRAYDDLLNTDAADRLRKRVDTLERTLSEVVDSGRLTPDQSERVKMILRNKFHQKY